MLIRRKENAFNTVYFRKKAIENNYRCDRPKLKAILIKSSKVNRYDKINLEVCLVMKLALSPQENA